MKNKLWSTIESQLQARTEIIAARWCQAVMASQKISMPPGRIEQQFVKFTQDIILMLGTAVVPREKAQAIGTSLVQLLFVNSDTIRHTQSVLLEEFVHTLSPPQAQFLLTRLSGLILEIGIGFANAWHELSTLHDTDENRFQSLFENAPISIWEEDFSEAIQYIRQLEATGITNIRHHFETHSEAVITCARLVRIIDVNQTTVDMYQAESKADFKNNLDWFFVPESYELFKEVILAAAEGKLWFSGETINQTATGKPFYIFLQWAVLPGDVADYSRVLVSIMDITKVKIADQEIRQQIERRQIHHRIDREILAARSPREIACVTIEQLHHLVPFVVAGITLHDESSNYFTILAASIKGPDGQLFMNAPKLKFPKVFPERSPLPLKSQIIELENLVMFSDMIPSYAALHVHDKHYLLEVPLEYQTKLFGAFYLLADEEIGRFTQEYRDITNEVADSLAVAIHNSQLLQEEKTARAQAEALRDVANMLHQNLNYEEILAMILERLTAVIETDAAAIMLEMGSGLEAVAVWGPFIQPPGLSPIEIRNLHYVAKVLDSCEPVIVADTSDTPFWREIPGTEHVRSWLGVPLLIQNRAIGLLTFDKDEAGFYSEKEAEVAFAFANQAAMTIENVRLSAEKEATLSQLETTIQHRGRDLNMVYEVTAVTNENLDLEPMLIEALHTIIGVIGSCVASVHSWDRESGTKQLLAQTKDVCHVFADAAAIDNLLSNVIVQSESVIIQGNPLSTPVSEISYIGIPIHAKGKIIGVLSLFGAAEANLAPEDLAMLTSVADHIGVNIENIRLRQEAADVAVLEERKRLAEDLHDAVTQGLYSLTLFGTAVQDRLRDGNLEEAQQYAVDIGTTARQSLKEMRLMLFELQDVTFEQEGLVKGLRHRLETVERRLGIESKLESKLTFKLPPTIERSLYFIANEALSNSLKHAEATTVSVSIWSENEYVLIKVSDNGNGFSLEEDSAIGGLGLMNMKNRAKNLGGIFNVETTPGLGTSILVKVKVTPTTNKARVNGAKT